MSDNLSQQQIAEDLGRKISDHLEELIQREMDLASQVLENSEQFIMLMKIARGMSIAAILYGLQGLKDGENAGAFFDTLRKQLDQMVCASKHEVLSVLPMVTAGMLREAHQLMRSG